MTRTSTPLTAVVTLLVLCGVVSSAVDVPPTDPNILYLGRWDKSDPSKPLATWSYSGLRVGFTGASITVNLPNKGSAEWYIAMVDGVEKFSGALSSGSIAISGLSDSGTHKLELHKRSEVDSGGSTFTGLTLDSGRSTVAWAAPSRRLEFVGDSITCGYGVLGANKDCAWSEDTVDSSKAYGALTANHFGALVNVECWSGIGLIRNYAEGTTSSTNMPYYYDWTAPTTSTKKYNWEYQPQGIVVNLGTNDYSPPETSCPSDSAFVSALVSFFGKLHTGSPSAHIFAACMDGWTEAGEIDNKCKNVQQAVTQFSSTWSGVHFVKLADLDENTELGCDWHPNRAGQQKMADTVIQAIGSALGWGSNPPSSSVPQSSQPPLSSDPPMSPSDPAVSPSDPAGSSPVTSDPSAGSDPQSSPGSCECSGGECCDGCQFKPSSTVRRGSVDTCDPQESCSGSSESCPADVNNCNGPTGGMLAHWRFDEGSGQTVADASGNGLAGTMSGMSSSAWVRGVSGGAMRFQKASGVVTVADDQRKLAPTGDSSWSIWVKFNSLGTDEPIVKNKAYQLYHRGSTSRGKLFWLVSVSDKAAKVGDSAWAGEAAVLTSTTFRTSRWYHVVGVRSGDNLLVYVNGRLDKTLACLAGQTLDPSVATPLTFGQFAGTLDEIKVFPVALSEAEVEAEFDKFSGRTTQDDPDDETSASRPRRAFLSAMLAPLMIALALLIQ